MAIISPGSGLFSSAKPVKPHLINGPGGISKEVADVRKDILTTLVALAAIAVEEMDAPAAAANTAFLLSTTTSASPSTLTGAALTGAIGPAAVPYPRNVTVTATAGSSSYAGSATIKGLDAHGVSISETIAITASTTVAGKKAFSKVTEIDIPAQLNTSGAISVGTGVALAILTPIKTRTGQTATSQPPFRELLDGAVQGTAGTLDATNGTYTPNTAANGTHNYVVYFEAVGG